MKPEAQQLVEKVQKAIEQYPQKELILSVYIWGSALNNRFNPGKSDLDILFVLKDSKNPMQSLQKILLLCEKLAPLGRLDVNINFESEVKQKIPYRPYINEEIADYGSIIYGKKTLRENAALDWKELHDALIFDSREFRRIFIRDNDPNWSHIIQKDIGIFFIRLTQLAGDFQPEIRPAIDKTVEHYPELAPFRSLFHQAYFSENRKQKIDAVMETLEILKAFVGQKLVESPHAPKKN